MPKKKAIKELNVLFYHLGEDDSLLIEPDDTRPALKAFKRWRHISVNRRNTYYDKIAQLYVFKEDGAQLIRSLRSLGFHLIEGLLE